MPRAKRSETRTKLLDAAEAMIDRQGFAATSIDQIIAAVGVTKGTFFYHFKSKELLARALLDRYAERDAEVLRTSMARAEKLAEQPLQQLLIFVGLLIEVGEELDACVLPGCLFATYCYETGLFPEETSGVIATAFESWTAAIQTKLEAVCVDEVRRDALDLEALADMATVLFEGSFVLARARPGRHAFARQLRHYRRYLQLLLEP